MMMETMRYRQIEKGDYDRGDYDIQKDKEGRFMRNVLRGEKIHEKTKEIERKEGHKSCFIQKTTQVHLRPQTCL